MERGVYECDKCGQRYGYVNEVSEIEFRYGIRNIGRRGMYTEPKIVHLHYCIDHVDELSEEANDYLRDVSTFPNEKHTSYIAVESIRGHAEDIELLVYHDGEDFVVVDAQTELPEDLLVFLESML